MNYRIPPSQQDLSQRKLEEYDRYLTIINWGRQNPVRFAETVFGLGLMDYQKWVFMNSWYRPFVLWLNCRAAGKTSLAAIYFMTKLLLIPNYTVYISTLTAPQSFETFRKLEDIALQRIPSFRNCNDVFAQEVRRSANSDTGFLHDPSGWRVTLFNNSSLNTLSSNINALRGKRGSIFYDEAGWQTKEQFAVTEHFTNVSADFSLSTDKYAHKLPPQMPLQVLFASSASDMTYPFYEKYKTFAKKMIAGDPNYFICDIDVNDLLNYTTVNGEPHKSHLTQSQIERMIEEDPDRADRELFNKFSKGVGADAVVRMETLIANSQVRKPFMENDTGDKKFIFCYDPARAYDNSVLAIFQEIETKKNGYLLQLENMISMVDKESKKKTPLPMPQQIDIIKEQLIKYNGRKNAEWENIEFYIDAGSGGGGVSAVADALLDDWVDKEGNKHRGMIDPDHKLYATSRLRYPNAAAMVHLLDPQSHKRVMFSTLEKFFKLGLIKLPEYDDKDYLYLPNDAGEPEEYLLSPDERMALVQCNLAKTELVYMRRQESPNGSVQYDLAKDK